MRVPLTNLCPQCKEARTVNRLNRDVPAKSQAVYCINPATAQMLHAFPSIEAAEAYEPNLGFLDGAAQAESEPAAETPAPALEAPVEAPMAKEAPPAIAAPALDPLPVETPAPRNTLPVAEDAHDEAIAKFVAKKEAPIVPPAPEIPQVGPAPKKKFTPPAHLKRAGGVIVLTVQIPDQHVSPMCAEAENQKESVEAFFQRMVEYGLNSGWFY